MATPDLHHVLVVLSPGFEEIEAVTAIDILRRAEIKVTTATLDQSTAVMGSHAIPIEADTQLSRINPDDYSVLALPGGMHGVENMLKSEQLLEIVRIMHKKNAILAAVCAAPLVFDRLGLLEGREFTCHPCIWDRISHPAQDVPTVTDGALVTGRSAGCAMPWSLALVEKLLGELPPKLLPGLRLP
ncbi:MAG: DJ-1/PfpI family protein [Proteobacteria bacterium]|nr:DJ-1/PfpI family protein [Pseudomonadota bacterium]